MGATISKQENGRRIHIGKVPKYIRKILKRKKYTDSMQDEVDSAVPLVVKDRGIREENDPDSQWSFAIETGNIEVFLDGACGYDNISSDNTESDRESMSSADVLEKKQRNPHRRAMLSSPDSAIDANYTTDTSVEECTICNATNTEYMVQVFMSTLQRNLDVRRILPYLHYISHNDARTLSETVPQELAVKNLLHIIMYNTSPQEHGKWTTFLVALEKTGYTYLHQLLTGDTEKDHFYTTEILKIMKPGLINDIHLDAIIDILIERGLVNEEDQGHIESAEKNKGPIAATRVLLEKVDKRLPDWDTEFADVLEKAGMADIASVFQMVEHHEHCKTKEDSPKQKCSDRKSFKRKFRKRSRPKCRLHNNNTTPTGQYDEPETKRKKTTENAPLQLFESAGESEPPSLAMQVEDLKQSMTEIKTADKIIEAITTMQKDLTKKMDDHMKTVMSYLTKTFEEHSSLKQQIEDQNQTLKYLNQSVSGFVMNQPDLNISR